MAAPFDPVMFAAGLGGAVKEALEPLRRRLDALEAASRIDAEMVEEEKVETPSWCVKEITGDSRYYNSNLLDSKRNNLI